MAEINSIWAPYAPDQQMPWNLRRVVHLHRRAGFAGTWQELQRDLKEGPAASVERFLTGQVSAAAVPGFGSTADLLAEAAVAAGDIGRVKAWWFYRMLFGPDPLGEKLTLLWHNHFATANSKVQNAALMQRQNETLRKHARGKFTELLNTGVREPALLLYLDAQANRKTHPNENLARELMELFTVGVGHYTEVDVKEAARALTGWTVEDGQFVEIPARHDTGEKTLFGKTGRFTGSDLINLLLEQPVTAERIALKLCRQFFGESAIPPAAMKELANGLREHDFDIGRSVAVILKSRLFFADGNLGNRVLDPVQFVVGAVRALELFDPAPSTLALADWTARMGQDLFNPPNVGGWPGGRAWIHTRSMIARANYAVALVSGRNVGRSLPYDAAELPRKYGFGSDADAVLTFHRQLLFGTDLPKHSRHRESGADFANLVATLLSSPEAQLV
jgi:uncharacterized protein (DUF1800 family)